MVIIHLCIPPPYDWIFDGIANWMYPDPDSVEMTIHMAQRMRNAYFIYEYILTFDLGSTWAMGPGPGPWARAQGPWARAWAHGPSGSKIKYKNIFIYEIGVTRCVSSS